MVYCGKPSRGCHSCRERKIRCDTAIPSCGQCLRKSEICPGYRSQLDLAFRNESSSVIKKAKASSRSSTRANQDPTATTEWETTCKLMTGMNASDPFTRSSPSGSPPLALINYAYLNDRSLCVDNLYADHDGESSRSSSGHSTFSLLPTIEGLGINFFFEKFVAQENGPSHGHFNYLRDICRSQGMDDTIRTSVIAAGLATFANAFKSPELMAKAREEYIVALRNINAALISPADAIKDSTLIAIMVVSIFETVTGATRLSLKAWTEHINGAATILKLRGRSQIKTFNGLRLFIHVTSHLLVSCVQRELSMPTLLRELRLEAISLMPPGPVWELLKVIDEFTVFRAAVRDGTLIDSETIISTALKYDDDLMQIFNNVPSGWLYESVYTKNDPDIIWNGSYDIYYDYWVAQIWNCMRATRIILNETVKSRLFEGSTSARSQFAAAECTTQLQISNDTLVKMRDGIFRSIPQQIGYVTRKPFTHPSYETSGTLTQPYYGAPSLEKAAVLSTHPLAQSLVAYNTPPPRTGPHPPATLNPPSYQQSYPTSPMQSTSPLSTAKIPAIAGYFLLWPLYTSGAVRVNSPESRAFAVKTLHYVGDAMGIMQGKALANFLDMSTVGGLGEEDFERTGRLQLLRTTLGRDMDGEDGGERDGEG